MRVGGIHQFKVSDGRNRLPPTSTTTPSYFEKQAGPRQTRVIDSNYISHMPTRLNR